jgi:hypothetical protein
MSDEQLRAELLKKAKRAKINVPDEWGVEEIETALGLKALEDEEAKAAEKPAEAAPVPAAAPSAPAGYVQVRITKHGHGKVFTGDGHATYSVDDMPYFPADVAKALEDRAYAEIR